MADVSPGTDDSAATGRDEAVVAADEPEHGAATIGRYSILKLLGEGGMGRVYAVYDDRLDRRIALKLVKRGGSEGAQRRMLREAQALAKINHPNVVSVFEVGEHEGQLFVAMEYVRGQSLKQWSAAKERDLGDVLSVYLQAGQGLAAVHREGLIHRDFKPDNAVIGDDNRVRVLDFGLAARRGLEQAPQATPQPRDQALDATLTLTGAVLGTPAYMPPEQFRSDAVDARSDQFSFCVALWEAMFGERPFKGATRIELFHAICAGALTQPERAEVPAGLRLVVERGLSPDPTDRWQDMPALLSALERHHARPRNPGIKLGIFAVAVAGAAAAYGFVSQRGDIDDMTTQVASSERVAAQQQAKAKVARQDRDEAVLAMQNALLISRAVLFEDAPTEATAMLREVAGPTPHEVFGWDDAAQAVRLRSRPLRAILTGHSDHLKRAWFDATGSHVITVTNDGKVQLFDSDGSGTPTVLDEGGYLALASAMSSDRTLVATASAKGEIRIIPVDGGGNAVLIDAHRNGVLSLEFSADDTQILSASADGTARVTPVSGAGDAVVFGPHDSVVQHAAFNAAATQVATASWDRTVRVFNADGTGEPLRFTDHTQDVTVVAFSPDGARVASGAMDGTARVFNVDGTAEGTLLAGHGGAVSSVLFSLDGEVVTAARDGLVRIFASEGTPPTELDYGMLPESIAFSPDGVRFVVTGDNGRSYVVPSHPPHGALELGGHDLEVVDGSFSADGQRVVTASNDLTARVYSALEPEPVRVISGHAEGVWQAAFSPDGTRIATASMDRTVRISNVDGSGPPVVLSGHEGRVLDVAFSPDGTHVVTASWDETVRLFAADGSGEPRVLTRHATKANGARFSPDGTQVVTASSDTTARILSVDGSAEPVVLADHEGAVIHADFSRDGQWIVTASSDTKVRVFSADGGDSVAEFPHPMMVYSAAFSPDGTQVVTACMDKVARVFNVDGTGAPRRLEGAKAMLFDAQFSPDGTLIVLASEDSDALLYRADSSGPPIARLSDHGEPVWSATFSPDGSSLATTSENGTTRIYAVDDLTLDLRTSLWRTPFCHLPSRRMQLLAETQDVANAGYERCLDIVATCSSAPYAECHARVTEAFGR